MAITCAQAFAFCLTTLAMATLIAGNALPIWKFSALDGSMQASVTTWRTCGDVDIDLVCHFHDCTSTQDALQYLQAAAAFVSEVSGSHSTTCTSSRSVAASAYGSIAVGLFFLGHLVALATRNRPTLIGFCLMTLCLPLAMIPAAMATMAVVSPLCSGESVTLKDMPGSSFGVGLFLLWASFLLFSMSSLMGCICVSKRQEQMRFAPTVVPGEGGIQYVAFHPAQDQQMAYAQQPLYVQQQPMYVQQQQPMYVQQPMYSPPPQQQQPKYAQQQPVYAPPSQHQQLQQPVHQPQQQQQQQQQQQPGQPSATDGALYPGEGENTA